MVSKSLIWLLCLFLGNTTNAGEWSYAGTFTFLNDDTIEERPTRSYSYFNSIQHSLDSTFFFLSIPIVYQNHEEIITNTQGSASQTSNYELELGDIYFSIAHDIISEENDNISVTLQLSFGLNVPTGDESKGQSTGEFDYDLGLL
ncbi:MAG: hypothetical protein K9K67_13755 [Bacteriovoracaceae bacterium]|nr:hypothetical protein [Bacteriovoracaceae bacterium]